jgi:hypothetical protein
MVAISCLSRLILLLVGYLFTQTQIDQVPTLEFSGGRAQLGEEAYWGA